MKNIHVLPTDKPSKLFIIEGKIFKYHKPQQGDGIKIINVNVYINSDEVIRVGDWYINTFVSEREQIPQTHTEKKQLINHQKDYRFKYCKKIILTTDQDLIKDGVQSIDDEFLEWFVKNPSCEEVEVEKGCVLYDFKYKIIIPKEEPKQETLEEFINSQPYYGSCTTEYLEGIEIGAKWQQEQDKNKYSEEDLKEAFSMGRLGKTDMSFKEWFEQFKNK